MRAAVANVVAEDYLVEQLRATAKETVRANDWRGTKLIKLRRETRATEILRC